ncbi:hypothetical protein HSB1_10360 [Halogranum salarium B-1]|uniref:Uncharacterized protein n=1 Tax=Halogranum salarium B-1 TaxID=1210908 RepID=J3A4N7_9EURY|nr:hypothetical protein HSB1_10360 [Halogranum salarium B-1]
MAENRGPNEQQWSTSSLVRPVDESRTNHERVTTTAVN